MTDLAKFDGLTIRATDADDQPLLDRWISADPAHSRYFDPEYFMGSEGSFAIEDSDGVVFFVRLAKVARVTIQFDMANGKKRQKQRVAKALQKGMAMLEVSLGRAGAEQWIFDTENLDLKRFATTSMGFRESQNELVRRIEPRIERPQEEEVA